MRFVSSSHSLPFIFLLFFFKKISVCFTYMRKLGWQRQEKNEEKEDSEMAMTINLSLTRLLFMEPFVNVIKFEVLFAASVRDSLTFCAFLRKQKRFMFDICQVVWIKSLSTLKFFEFSFWPLFFKFNLTDIFKFIFTVIFLFKLNALLSIKRLPKYNPFSHAQIDFILFV